MNVERDRRKALGIYYTPPEAAKVLAKWLIRNPDDIVLEPSFGGCAMLSAAAEMFKSLGNLHPSSQLYGYDVDATAFDYLAKIGISNVDGHFKNTDFLLSSPENFRVDAVLANPPFVSYHRMNENQRQLTEQLRQKHLPILPKKASLWAYFLLHSLSFLRSGGRMAFVLPNAISTADYSQPLLNFLRQHFIKVELIHLSERLFIQAGADERVSLLLLSDYYPDGSPDPAPLDLSDVKRIEEIVVSTDSTVLISKHRKIANVRDEAAAALATLGKKVFCELGDVASIRIGEVIGDVRFFVKPQAEWVKLKIDKKYLFPLLTRSNQVRGCYVYSRSDNRYFDSIPFLLLPPKDRLPIEIETYLAQYSEQAIINNRTFGKRPIWYCCSYTINADAFIGSMTHDYPRIIGNDAGISCSNAFYKITVHKHLNLIAWLPILSLTTPLRLSAEILGRVRGSGGIKLEPSDVKKLCIPTILPQMRPSEFKVFQEEINNMLIHGEIDAANQLADAKIYLQSGIVNAHTMSKLRLMRLGLSNYRFGRPKRL